MSKLYFEDDSGNRHDIIMQTVKTSGLKKGDIVVVNYEVGDASPEDSSSALQQLHQLFKKMLPEGVEPTLIATRNGKKDITLKVIKDKTQE